MTLKFNDLGQYIRGSLSADCVSFLGRFCMEDDSEKVKGDGSISQL